MKKVTKSLILKLAKRLKIDLDNVPLDDIYRGTIIELEHGKIKKLDVIHGNVLIAMKIALAHIEEYPDYYKRLKQMEKKAHSYWSKQKRPKSIFLKQK